MWLWHLNSLLDLFCLGPWGWEGLVSGLWCVWKVRLFVSLLLCFDSLTPLGSVLMCRAQLCVRLLHGMSLWFVFVLGTDHPSCSLLCKLSQKQAIADRFIWKTCVCWKLYRKFSILWKTQYCRCEGMGGIAAMLQFPFSPFLLWLEKNLTIIVHLSKEYSSHSAVSALSWWFWLRCQERTPPNPIVGSEKLLFQCFAKKQHPVSRISEKGDLLNLHEKVRPSPVNPAKKGQCGEPTCASFVTCQCWTRYT